FFGEAALERAIAELAHPGNILDTYILSEEIALAAAALFHGSVMGIPDDISTEELYELAVGLLAKSYMPGSIVITTGDQSTVCMIYIFDGKIVGVFSHEDGWVEPEYESALAYLRKTPDARVSASLFTVKTSAEIFDLTFSLTGLSQGYYRAYGEASS